jgi:hypothetical protein
MDTATPPPAAHPHPPAGGRSDGPQAGAPGSDRRGAGCAKRVMPPKRGHPAVIARRNRVTGVQAARRHPGDVAACRPALPDNHGRAALCASRIPPGLAAGHRARAVPRPCS